MSESIYKKVGRRYVEIGVHEHVPFYYPIGSHMVVAREGGVLTRYNITPENSAVEAALERVSDAMAKAMTEATHLKPTKMEWTEKERAAIIDFEKATGGLRALQFEGVSMRDVINAGIDILRKGVEL